MGLYGGIGMTGSPYGGYRVGGGGSQRGGRSAAPQKVEVICQKAEKAVATPVTLEDMRYCRDCTHVWYGAQANCPACWGQRSDRYERKQLGLRIYLFPTSRAQAAQRAATESEFRKDRFTRQYGSEVTLKNMWRALLWW